MDVPLTCSLDILDHHFERVEVESRHSVKGNVEEDEGPFEEGVDRVSCARLATALVRKPSEAEKLTSRHAVDFVLDEEVDQGHQSTKEGAGNQLAVLDGLGVRRAQHDASNCPREGCDNVGDHEDVVPVVVVGRSDVGEATAHACAQNAHRQGKLWQCLSGSPRQEIPQSDECESRARGDCDEEHEEGPLGVTVANCRGNGGEPLVGVAVPLILDNLVVVQ